MVLIIALLRTNFRISIDHTDSNVFYEKARGGTVKSGHQKYLINYYYFGSAKGRVSIRWQLPALPLPIAPNCGTTRVRTGKHDVGSKAAKKMFVQYYSDLQDYSDCSDLQPA